MTEQILFVQISLEQEVPNLWPVGQAKCGPQSHLIWPTGAPHGVGNLVAGEQWPLIESPSPTKFPSPALAVAAGQLPLLCI